MPTQLAVDITVAKQLRNHHLNVPVEVVSNGIELSRFTPDQPRPEIYQKYNIPRSVPIVLYVGRLDIEKHVSVLVEAFSQIPRKTKAHLLLVGDGTDISNIKRQIKKLGISERVTLTGRLDRDNDDIVDLYRVGTVFCIPSPSDLQSIVTLEAMACGQPIVAIDAGALRELCHDGKNGFLCEKDNVNEISDSLHKIISDPQLRTRFSKESRKIAATHDLTRTIKRFEEIYEEVITSFRADN